MSCSRRRRRSESIAEEVEAERESFRESKCFLVIWRDRCGRRRCKCCCRRCRD